MRRVLLNVILVTILISVASGAVAGDCKKVFARVDYGPFYSDCSYGGMDYLWCSDSRVRGNLRGVWSIYANPEFNCFENTVPDGVLGIDGWDIWSCWNLSVFETKHGSLITQGNDYVNVNAYFTYGAFSSTLLIVEGTGKFEGATGWLGNIGDEVTGKGILRGEICTP